MVVDRNDKRFFDFMCSCSEKGEARCEKAYEDVKAELEADDKDFTEAVVFALDGLKHGMANIEHIYTDMWSGIAVRYQYDYNEEIECEDDEVNCKCDTVDGYDCQWTVQDFWIECDRIRHGLARAYQLVKEFDASVR
jgi:hypothetical protein